MRNSNRNGADLLAIGVVGFLGFIAFKALTSSSGKGGAQSRRPLALPAPRKDFLVLYSTHGSNFHFADGSTDVPAGPFLTFSEAAADAQRYESATEAVDGHSLVLEVSTGDRYSPYPRAAAQ